MITYIFYNVKRIGVNMLNLVRNELIKIFKRKNIYVLFLVVILVIMGYNMFERYSNNIKNIDIRSAEKGGQILICSFLFGEKKMTGGQLDGIIYKIVCQFLYF